MGTLTYTELQDEVRSGLGSRTDLDSRLGRFVNLAQQRLARLHDFDEMKVISTTTIANTSSDDDKYLTLPSVREVYSMVLLDGSNSRKITQKSSRYWDTLIPKPEYWSRSRPVNYTIWGSATVELWPLPNATYTLRMRWSKWPAALSAGADYSEFLQKDEILIELALSYAYRSLAKEEDAAKHEAFALRLLNEAERMDSQMPDLEITPLQSTIGTVVDPWLDPFNRGD
jgi:hypothetical protein